MLRTLFFAIIFFLSLIPARSSHIVGGDFTATWVFANASNTASTYRLKLTLYRDCDTGTAPFDPQISVGIFDRVTNQVIDTFLIDLAGSGPLVLALGNQCSPPPQICVEGGVYTIDVEIPNNPNGYYISWERCCRNSTVNNLVNPDDTGITFYLELPDPAMHNSTPRFANDPLTYMCEEQPFSYNFAGFDPDGDSLAFELVTPVSGTIGYPVSATPQAVWPGPIPAPYSNAIWATGYGLNNICGGVPLTIDAITGEMNATPDFFGKYSAAVECREYRNGVQIGMIRREIQFNVIICNGNSFPDVSFNAPIKNQTIYAGDTACFTYFVRDLEGDSLWLTYSGDVFPGGPSGPPYAATSGQVGVANVITDFCWFTSCDQARVDPYNVIYTSKDNGCPFALTVNDTIKITVLPAPLIERADMLCMDLTTEDRTTVYFGVPPNTDPEFFKYYIVYRSLDGSAFVPVDTINDHSKDFFIDNKALNHNTINYCYYIVGVNVCDKRGLISDTICSENSANNEINYLKSVSVLNNSEIVLKWKDFPNSDFATIRIFRKINSPLEQFSLISTIVNPQNNIWIDRNVNSSQFSYCYQIITEDNCGNVSPKSNIACSILLTGKSLVFKHNLNWTEYRKWNGGVQKYELWRKGNRDLKYSKIDGIGFTTSFSDENLNYDEGKYKYRVRAIEGPGGENAESFSNVLTLEQEPIIFLPNAFSPNDDYANDRWGAVTGFVKDFRIAVFDRWGQLVFNSIDPNEMWDGQYKGSPAPNGVYVYRVFIRAYGDQKARNIEGSVTLLR
ncbi:MAG: T9SS type B sorting domain-containing protein [Bacteroidia bacterium]|nr:T9SS type B sorting domain-containing protein [Bacteroidia bacterium]